MNESSLFILLKEIVGSIFILYNLRRTVKKLLKNSLQEIRLFLKGFLPPKHLNIHILLLFRQKEFLVMIMAKRFFAP